MAPNGRVNTAPNRGSVLNKRGPDFLGIGAARSGTTWIAANLGRCDQVWLPARKELHYWTRSEFYPSPSFLDEPSLLRRLVGRRRRHKEFRRVLTKAIARNIVRPNLTQLWWDARFHLGRHDDDWYANLFPANRIAGEITPAYALLEEKAVHAIANSYPHLKIIFIMRDPIERAWSTVRYHQNRGMTSLGSADPAMLCEYLSQRGILERARYDLVFDKWTKYFPADQLFFAFYEDVVANPTQLLNRLFRFLGITDTTKAIVRANLTRVNSSPDREMPIEVRTHLSAQYIEMLEALSQRIANRHVSDWLERARNPAESSAAHRNIANSTGASASRRTSLETDPDHRTYGRRVLSNGS